MSELTVAAPPGSHFEWEQVADKGDNEWDVPILIWDDLSKATEYYGAEGIMRVLDGTSLRVAFQGIARRFASAKEPKTANDTAKAMVDYKPGERRAGESTPSSRAARSAKKAIDANPNAAEAIEKLLAKLAAGEADASEVLEMLS
jgi:hypothetical protein